MSKSPTSPFDNIPMGKQLQIDEMLDIMENNPHLRERLREFAKRTEALCQEMGNYLADKLGVNCGEATYEGTAYGGTCACLYPRYKNQPVPKELEDWDTGSEWQNPLVDEASQT